LFDRSSGRMPPAPPIARYGRNSFSPGPARGRSSGPASHRAPPWVRVSTRFNSSPPESPTWGRFGGRDRERGAFLAPSRIRRFVALFMLVGTKRVFANRHLLAPSPQPSPPTQKTVGGEGRHGRELRPRPPRLLPLAAPWAMVQRPRLGALEGRSGLLPLHICPI